VNHLDDALELAMPAEQWEIALRDGGHLTVVAHAYSVEGTEVVFSLLFKGTPHYEVDVLSIPLSLLPDDFA